MPTRTRSADFPADSFNETIEGINGVAASGNPLAETGDRGLAGRPPVLQRRTEAGLLQGRRRRTCSTPRPASRPPPPPADLSAGPRSTTALRGDHRGRARQPDAVVARSGASASTRRRPCSSRAMPNALPALDPAIAKETDPRIKRALIEARAAVILYHDGRQRKPTRSMPSRVIRERGDQDALALLSRPAGQYAAGRARRPRRTRSPRSSSTLALWETVQNAWYGLSLGSVLLLAAIGLAITFGVMGVINMAHGEMVMLGAYTTFVVQEIIRTHNPAPVRLFAVHRDSARLPGRRLRRHPDRARHHPLSLRPPARDPARHLGPFADPAAGGAHRPSARPTRTSAIRPG